MTLSVKSIYTTLWDIIQRGLLDRLRRVPVAQKAQDFPPQAKLIEFLAGIMTGIQHLQDLNHGPRPLAHDPVVAQAWGLEGFAHYTTVLRTPTPTVPPPPP